MDKLLIAYLGKIFAKLFIFQERKYHLGNDEPTLVFFRAINFINRPKEVNTTTCSMLYN